MPDGTPDNELVRRFKRGDRDAFVEFARRHQDRLFRLASVWLFDPQQAADATQETLLRSFTGLKGFRHEAHPTTWLFRMLKNVCHEMNRRKTPHTDPTDPTCEPGPEGDLVTDESVAAVRRLVAGLPERQRDVVMLRVFEDLSVDDTARVMDCRPGTVKAHLNKAMKTLRTRGKDL